MGREGKGREGIYTRMDGTRSFRWLCFWGLGFGFWGLIEIEIEIEMAGCMVWYGTAEVIAWRLQARGIRMKE